MQARNTAPTLLLLAGAVLAGGRSTRMGRDKARLVVDGVPLWRRQRGVLEAAGAGSVVVVLRPRQRSLGNRRAEIRDPLSDRGPLAGLQAALVGTRAAWLAVLAVDMPRVDPRWFRRLRRHCRAGVGAVVRTADGYEPLAAIYPRAALSVVERRLQGGQLALQGLIRELVRRRQMVAVRLPASALRQAANWNTPADVAKP
jgi:molybdopterin-guanine dinucleotide biosynthesis protein A